MGGAEAKIKFFQNIVMLHIKLKLRTPAATWYQIFCPQTHHSWPKGWGQKVKLYLLLKVVMLQNWAQSTMKASVLSLHTPTTPGVGSKGHFCSFLKVVMLHIKVKWKKCRPTCKVTLWIYTQSWPLRLGFKVRYWNCADVSIFFIELSTKTYLTGVCYDLNDTVGELRVR